MGVSLVFILWISKEIIIIMGKNVLIIGSGGREHALGWKLKQSKHVENIYFVPGNGGTAKLGENIKINSSNTLGLLKFAKKNKIDLTVVGPEDTLNLGIVDKFQRSGLLIFGPTKKASKLESSKGWFLKFAQRHKIPVPKFRVFSSYERAVSFVDSCSWGDIVIKADGLAGGKGVVLPKTKEEAMVVLKEMIVKGKFNESGRKVVIQERLYGEEVSVMAFCDGINIKVLTPAQDHKKVNDGDKGPNTGGMGAFSPVPMLNKKQLDMIEQKILMPTVDGMRKEGSPFKGLLFAGLIITRFGPVVLEYNVRFGDPETQVQLLMLKSDLFSHLFACARGKLASEKVEFNKGFAVTVVLACLGYPGFYTKGQLIHGLDQDCPKDIIIFHAGTKLTQGQHFSIGGRVLNISTRAGSLKTAIKKTYEAIDNKTVYFKSMHYRKDIGAKALVKRIFRVVILISGIGSTMEQIIKASKNEELMGVKVVGVISSDKTAHGIRKARKMGVSVKLINPNDKNFAGKLLKLIDSFKPDLVSQNGWLPLTPTNVIKKYNNKIINQHPAPLDPEHRIGKDYDFGGFGMYGLVPHIAIINFRNLVKRDVYTEATVHLVTEKYDQGPVVGRRELKITKSDTPESLQKKLLPIEHETVINVIRKFASGEIEQISRQKPFVEESERKLLIRAKNDS